MAKAVFRVSKAARQVEYDALELIRLAESYTVSITGHAMREQRRTLLEAARQYASSVRATARVRG